MRLIYALVLLLLFGGSRLAAAPELGHAPFVVYSLPKCGTHLLIKTLRLLLEEEPCWYHVRSEQHSCPRAVLIARSWGQYPLAHEWRRGGLEEVVRSGYKVILHVRDPRDQMVSFHHWWKRGNGCDVPMNKMKDPEKQFTEMITGERFGRAPPEQSLCAYEIVSSLPAGSWHLSRFEDLVGEKGGGNRETQIRAISDLALFLGIEKTREEIEFIADHLFGRQGSRTFDKGQIGRWREYFSPRHEELFVERYSSLMEELGYKW